MRVHQVFSVKKGIIHARDVSCYCSSSQCKCFQPTKHNVLCNAAAWELKPESTEQMRAEPLELEPESTESPEALEQEPESPNGEPQSSAAAALELEPESTEQMRAALELEPEPTES